MNDKQNCSREYKRKRFFFTLFNNNNNNIHFQIHAGLRGAISFTLISVLKTEPEYPSYDNRSNHVFNEPIVNSSLHTNQTILYNNNSTELLHEHIHVHKQQYINANTHIDPDVSSLFETTGLAVIVFTVFVLVCF